MSNSSFSIDLGLLTYILSWLPLKTLFRFKYLSKSVLLLIESPQFVELHLHSSTNSGANLAFILYSETPAAIHCVDVDLRLHSHSIITFSPPPFLSPCIIWTLFGSCNGLLAFWDWKCGLALWNPYRFKDCLFVRRCWSDSCIPLLLGFGHDDIHNDYKVLVVFKVYSCYLLGYVYSVREDSWRKVAERFPCRVDVAKNGVLGVGALHWIADPQEIVAFDLAFEQYRRIPQPDGLESEIRYKELDLLKECLSMVIIHENADIWVMKEYGVKESWSKLFTVSREEFNCMYLRRLTTARYSKEGDKVLMVAYGGRTPCRPRSFWYDLTHERVEEIQVYDLPSDKFVFKGTFAGSLVSLHDAVGRGKIEIKLDRS